MSTRCTVTVHDADDKFTLYRHMDGYPDTEHGVVNTLRQAFRLAWPLPRFEADDFGAAIVAAWKSGGGNIRMCLDRDQCCDTEFHYDVTVAKGGMALLVQVSVPRDISDDDRAWTPQAAFLVSADSVKPIPLPKRPRKPKLARAAMQLELARAAGFRAVA